LNDRALARIDVSAIRMPDSKAAIHAEELMQSLSAPWLVNHCMRTWLWGVMFAQAGNIRFDEELYFVASVLHDLGLTDEHKCGDGCTACFAVQGARMAEQFAGRQGWSAERQHRLSDAISLHMNARVSIAHGAEAHLLHQGAALDVVGARMAEIGQPVRQTVLEKYPRLGFKKSCQLPSRNRRYFAPVHVLRFLKSSDSTE
jgi:HD superfamily phosphodiesterase